MQEESKEGIHYPLYIQRPAEVNITVDQFNNLSYIGIASLLISWRYVLEPLDQGDYILYTNHSNGWDMWTYPRFKDLKWYYHERAEMYMCFIPKDNPLCQTIKNYFSHLILKTDD